VGPKAEVELEGCFARRPSANRVLSGLHRPDDIMMSKAKKDAGTEDPSEKRKDALWHWSVDACVILLARASRTMMQRNRLYCFLGLLLAARFVYELHVVPTMQCYRFLARFGVLDNH
jgi:hypothetical protein